MELNVDNVFTWSGNVLISVHVTSVFMISELFTKANCLCSVLWLYLRSFVTLGFVVCIVLYWFVPLKGLRNPWREDRRRGCLSFPTQYTNIAVFQKEHPVYRMAIINFFYRKLKLTSGQLGYIIHLENSMLVPSQQILFTFVALCSFLLLFLAKFKYNRTVL